MSGSRRPEPGARVRPPRGPESRGRYPLGVDQDSAAAGRNVCASDRVGAAASDIAEIAYEQQRDPARRSLPHSCGGPARGRMGLPRRRPR